MVCASQYLWPCLDVSVLVLVVLSLARWSFSFHHTARWMCLFVCVGDSIFFCTQYECNLNSLLLHSLLHHQTLVDWGDATVLNNSLCAMKLHRNAPTTHSATAQTYPLHCKSMRIYPKQKKGFREMHSMPIGRIPIDYFPWLSCVRCRFLPIDLLSYLLANSFLSLSMEMLHSMLTWRRVKEIVVFFFSFCETFKLNLNWAEIMHFYYSIGRQLHWVKPFLFHWRLICRWGTHKSQRNRFQSAFLLFVLVSDANINYYMPTYATTCDMSLASVCECECIYEWDCVAIIKRHCSRPNLFCTHITHNSQSPFGSREGRCWFRLAWEDEMRCAQWSLSHRCELQWPKHFAFLFLCSRFFFSSH